jgi:hypothetical protein
VLGNEHTKPVKTRNLTKFETLYRNRHVAGLIQYNRGKINVVNRPKLEARVCECYMAVKQEYERLMSGPVAA